MSTTLLLTHLQNPNPKVDLSTLSAALAHHLTVEVPGPISLAAATVSSPFFLAYPPTNERLQALVTTFQHAAQLRHKALVKKAGVGWSLSRAIFSESVEKGLRNWAHAVIRGMQGGRGVIRLACSVGLLLGITGLQRSGFTDGRVEDEIIISLAEVMDDFSAQTGDWEKEFRPPMNETVLSLTLILASQSLPLIPKPKLKTLPMSLLANFLASTIDSAFHHGNFLKPIPRSTTSDLLSKLAATILGILIDSSKTGLQDSLNMMHTFRNTAHRIERSWKGSKLATIHSDDELSPETRDLSTGIWLLLKTLLFSIVMVADSVLGAAVYARPSQSLGKSSPQELAECILLTLSHIAFVVSELGGVTATATGNDPGFAELRKVFYLALDVLAFQEKDTSTLNYCELFVKKLVADLGVHACTLRATGAFDQAKIAYTLACIEQLVPSLGVSCLADDVWGLCVPYLVDPSHRETFESAHSVILSIFTFHAQQRCGGDLFETQHDERITESTSTSPDATQFVHRMIPYYAQCLIEVGGYFPAIRNYSSAEHC
ncbi:hypothetical protein H0H81_001541 [Sphagnurus paluster]|uniref:Uncharacterized protein n=1 Tax=Sphagnurus paluster TaxID=117069 RepID=A0A9P7K4Q1_9AGAR|nr:hypothetical protein H0H81_001541 [Sphagnurus paluster]